MREPFPLRGRIPIPILGVFTKQQLCKNKRSFRPGNLSLRSLSRTHNTYVSQVGGMKIERGIDGMSPMYLKGVFLCIHLAGAICGKGNCSCKNLRCRELNPDFLGESQMFEPLYYSGSNGITQ